MLPAEDDPANLTADDNKLIFTYDYLNRRVRKVVYAWDPEEGESGDWSATAELDLRFMYHERLLLLELDGLDSNAKVRKYVWGPGSHGRLGGLNSLLGMRDVDGSSNHVCFNDGAGKLVQVMSRTSTGCPYENYEDDGLRAAPWQACTWDPPFWWPYCDTCDPCYLGYSITVRRDIWHNGPIFDMEVPMCSCGPSPDNPGKQRRRRGPDDPCVTGAAYCGGCGAGTTLPGWIIDGCASWPDDEDDEGPTTQPDQSPCDASLEAAKKANKKMIDWLKEKGCYKGVKCLPPGDKRCEGLKPGDEGAFTPSDGSGPTKICSSTTVTAELLSHELIHQRQTCPAYKNPLVKPGKDGNLSLPQYACREIQAVACSGECGSKQKKNLDMKCVRDNCIESVTHMCKMGAFGKIDVPCEKLAPFLCDHVLNDPKLKKCMKCD